MLFSLFSLLVGAPGFASESISEEASLEAPAEQTCFSIQPHISDAWCEAVACHPVYADFCSTGHEDVEEEIDEEPESIIEPEVEQCVSAAPHISDSWCEAVECAPVFVESGLCTFI